MVPGNARAVYGLGESGTVTGFKDARNLLNISANAGEGEVPCFDFFKDVTVGLLVVAVVRQRS